MTGGMLPQRVDTLALIDIAQAHNKPVVVGGPDPTSVPEVYAAADFRVLGEAEGVIGAFIAAWDAGARSGTFEVEKFQVDVTTTPLPRFDLDRVQALLLHGRAVQPRLPLQLRVLRHHRALRPRAALQDERADAGRARCALSAPATAVTSTSSTTT